MSFLHSMLRQVGTRDWLRLGIRRRIVSLFFRPDGRSSHAFEVPFHGIRYRGNISNAQDWHVYFFGGYELKEAAALQEVMARIPEATAFDVGANLGGHSYVLARHAAVVHAFEPFGPLADRIAAQLERNGTTNVRLHRFGLGDTESVKPYYLDLASSNSGTGSFIPEHTGASEVGRLQIRRGDDWAQGVRPDLIKIDVEGYEAPVLAGLRDTLARAHPVILMEVTETTKALFDAQGGLRAVLPYAFRAYEVVNPRYRLGLLQPRPFALRLVADIVPRRASFNLLVLPENRTDLIAGLSRFVETGR